jgi:hypothetical protein
MGLDKEFPGIADGVNSCVQDQPITRSTLQDKIMESCLREQTRSGIYNFEHFNLTLENIALKVAPLLGTLTNDETEQQGHEPVLIQSSYKQEYFSSGKEQQELLNSAESRLPGTKKSIKTLLQRFPSSSVFVDVLGEHYLEEFCRNETYKFEVLNEILVEASKITELLVDAGILLASGDVTDTFRVSLSILKIALVRK